MITRPLDLASRLRREPRSYDWLFFVNVALIAFYFVLFGSRFVLSPGLGVDFALPQVDGASGGARPVTQMITVVNAGQIFVSDGLRSIDQLPDWLTGQAKTARHPSLLIRASADVPTKTIARIVGMAHAAGFEVTLAAEDAKASEGR